MVEQPLQLFPRKFESVEFIEQTKCARHDPTRTHATHLPIKNRLVTVTVNKVLNAVGRSFVYCFWLVSIDISWYIFVSLEYNGVMYTTFKSGPTSFISHHVRSCINVNAQS